MNKGREGQRIRSGATRRGTVQYITGYSNRPPCLCLHVRLNIRIAELIPRPIRPPSVASNIPGLVGENESSERRARVMSDVCKLLPNIRAILGHHRYSESVPSDVDTIFCEPHESF